MVCCAVYGCKNNNNKKLKKKLNNMSFFTFPKDDLCKVWVTKCSRKEKFNTKFARICSEHFENNDFERNLKNELLNIVDDKKKFKKSTIPTLKLKKTNKVQTSDARTKRLSSRQNKIMVEKLLKRCEHENTNSELPVVPPNSQFEKNSLVESSPIDSTPAVDIAEMKLALDKIKADVEKMKENIENLQAQNQVLTVEKLELTERLASKSNTEMKLKKIFTPGQIRIIQYPHNKKIQWSVKDISHAVSLHAAGPRAYRWLQKNIHPLPGESTLRRWANKIDISPGLLKFVFNLLASYKLPNLDRVCILLSDEIKIKEAYEYDKNNDTLLKPAKYAQVIMARGLFSDWKQPLYYAYDRNVTKPLLFEIIQELHNIRFDVVAITNDLGGGNRGLWNTLEITKDNPFFLNPNTCNKIYAFADVPHLVKLIRNHFLDSPFQLNGKKITKDPLLELYRKTTGKDLNIAHKLTKLHLEVKNAGRQKVKLATQLFSHTNATAIKRLATLGLMESENWQECAFLLKSVNDWFDVFNTRCPTKDSRERVHAYGLTKSHQDQILHNTKNIFADLKVGKNKSILPFQKGILISSNALPLLYKDLKRRYDIKYLLTSRLNQDTLESFFGIIRAIGGLNDHPTALEFIFRLRNYLLGRNETILSNAIHVIPDNSQNVFKDMDIDFIRTISLQDSAIETLTSTMLKDFKMRFKENLGDPTSQCVDSSYSWTNTLSEGGLYKPNDDFLNEIYN